MEKKETGLLDRFIVWREKHISQNQFILVLSLIILNPLLMQEFPVYNSSMAIKVTRNGLKSMKELLL